MAGREANGARIGVEVVEPQPSRVVDQGAEQASPSRELTDRPARLLVDAVRDEAFQIRAARIDHAKGGVARLRQLRGVLGDQAKQLVQRQF